MEQTINEIKAFLKEFSEQAQSPTSEENVPAKIIGNYSLYPEDVTGQVIDWIFNYLENRKCPHHLAVVVAKKTAQQIESMLSEQYMVESVDESQGKLYNSVMLYSEAVKMLPSICNSFLDQSNLEEMCSLSSFVPLQFVASVFAIKNKRRKMEDRHVIHHDLNALLDLKNVPRHSYYAVFDGHSGIDAASYASAQLHVNIVKHPSFLTDTVTAIHDAFKVTDENFLKICAKENVKSGCTAVCALIRENTVYLSWLGDSQAVLVKQGKPFTLTNPHKPEREDERRRIESLGGHITFMGIWRVNGIIAVTRALGDPDHKPFISSEPEMSVLELDGTEDFLILACDGLWDGLSPEDVSNALYTNIIDSAVDEPLDTVAAKLVHQSKIQGSEDNITVVVIFLRDIRNIKEDTIKLMSRLSQPAVRLEDILDLNGEKKCNSEDLSNISFTKPTVLELNAASSKKLKNTANVLSSAGFGSSSYSYNYSENVEGASFQNISPDFSSVEGAQNIFIPHQNLASCFAPEATALSELPTPPIDDVLASQQFEKFGGSDLYQGAVHCQQNYSAENDVYSFDNSSLLNSGDQPQYTCTNNLAAQLNSDITDASGVNLVETKEVVLSHDSSITPDEAVGIASCVVTNAIETAVKCLSSTELPETRQTPQKLNPYAEPFVMKSFFAPESSGLQDKSETSSEQFLIQENTSNSSPVKESNELINIQSVTDTVVMADTDPPEPKESTSIDQNIFKSNETDKNYADFQNISTGDLLDAATLIATSPENSVSKIEPIIDFDEQTVQRDLNSEIIESTNNESSLKREEAKLLTLFKQDNGQELIAIAPFSEPDIVCETTISTFDSKHGDNANLIDEHTNNLIPENCSSSVIDDYNNLITEVISCVVMENPDVSVIESTTPSSTENGTALASESTTDSAIENITKSSTTSVTESTTASVTESTTSSVTENATASVTETTTASVTESTNVNSFAIESAGTSVIESMKAHITEKASNIVIGTSVNLNENADNIDFVHTENMDLISEYTSDKVTESSSSLASEDIGKTVTENVSNSVIENTGNSMTEISGNLKSENPNDPITLNIEESKISETSSLLEGITKESISLINMQNELLKTTEVVLPTDQAVEELHVETFAVDLQSVPDGIPEAEGVTEDIDSDSEKDGGWSYMKGNTVNGSKIKTDEKKTKVEKSVDGKSELSSKGKKEISKPSELKNKIKTTSTVDKSKKTLLEKKTVDVKDKSRMVKSSTLATVTKNSFERTSRTTAPSRLKKENTVTTTRVGASIPSKLSRPFIPKNVGPATKPGNVTNVTSTKTVTSSIVNVKPKTTSTTVHEVKSNIQSISSTLPKGQPSNQSNKPNIASARSTSNRLTTSVPSRVTSMAKPTLLSRPSASESKTKQPATVVKKTTTATTLKKSDVKETKDSMNKQISAGRNITVATRRVDSAASSTISNKRTTTLSNKASVSKTFSSTSVKSETSKKDVPKIPPSKFYARSAVTTKMSKVETKGKDKNAFPVQNKEDQKKSNLANVVGEERNVDVVSASEEEKFILETNDKETVIKEQNEISPNSSEKPLENGSLTECVKLVEDATPTNECTPESLL